MPPKPTPEQLALRGFFQRIEKNFEDTEAWRGYAKLLVARRDVRGESILRWHEKRDFDAFVTERGQDLFGEDASEVVPDGFYDEPERRMFVVRWHMGFVSGLKVVVPRGVDTHKVKTRLSVLLSRPIFMLMREFRVELFGGGDTWGFVQEIRPTTIHNIRTIGFAGVNEGPERYSAELGVDWWAFRSYSMDNTKYGGGAAEPHGPSGLQRIELDGRFRIPKWSSEKPPVPTNLRELLLRNDNFIDGDVSELAAWQLPALQRLELNFGRGKLSSASDEDLDRCFGAPWPALRVLSIYGCRFEGELVAALLRSPLLDRAIELDLRANELTEAHVKALTERAPNVVLRVDTPA